MFSCVLTTIALTDLWTVFFTPYRTCSTAAGVIDVYVGGQQPNQATSASSNVLHGQVTVAGLKSSNTVRQTKTAPKWKPAGFERLPDHL